MFWTVVRHHFIVKGLSIPFIREYYHGYSSLVYPSFSFEKTKITTLIVHGARPYIGRENNLTYVMNALKYYCILCII